MQKKKLPVGIENFEDIRKKGFYYIDKTGLIRDLLRNWSMVNLFARPRRFGKTLKMKENPCEEKLHICNAKSRIILQDIY